MSTITDDGKRRCPHCGKRVRLTVNGKLRVHVDRDGLRCFGSGLEMM